MTLRIAHRGASADFPENTLLAFEQAIVQGANGFELDIQRSADGVPIVLHDETLERTTNGQGPSARLNAAELQTLDAGHGEPVPIFREVLERFAGQGITILVEIKDAETSESVAKEIDQTVASGGWRYEQLPVICFQTEVLRRVRAASPHIRIGVSADSVTATHLALAKELDAFAVIPDWRELTPAIVSEAHTHGLQVITWTCNDEVAIRQALALKVDGIMSDHPLLLGHLMQNASEY